MDDLEIHKMAKGKIDCLKRIDDLDQHLDMLVKRGKDKIHIIAMQVELDKLRKILKGE